MASVQDKKITEALYLRIFFLIMLQNEFDIAEIKVLWLLHLEIWDRHFTSESSIFSVVAGWIAEMLLMLFFTCIIIMFFLKVSKQVQMHKENL